MMARRAAHQLTLALPALPILALKADIAAVSRIRRMLRRDFTNNRRSSSFTSLLRLRSGGAKRKLLIFLALVAAVVALLPTIIAKTPLRNSLLSAVVPGNSVHVSIGSASLSWISGPALSDVQVSDSAGNPLLTADSVTIDRTPLNLLTNMHDCGVVAINRPQFFLKLRPDGSNVEDALQQLLAEITKNAKPPAEQPTHPRPLRIRDSNRRRHREHRGCDHRPRQPHRRC